MTHYLTTISLTINAVFAFLLITCSLLFANVCGNITEISKRVDRLCIVGRLSGEQVEAIAALPWGHKTRLDAGGGLRPGDRVLNKYCSQFLRELYGRNG